MKRRVRMDEIDKEEGISATRKKGRHRTVCVYERTLRKTGWREEALDVDKL